MVTIDTLEQFSEWLQDTGLRPRSGCYRGRWLIELVGPRGGVQAKGYGESWLEAVVRAVSCYEQACRKRA